MSTLQGSPDSIDAGTASLRDEVVPAGQEMGGFRGVLALADRSTGKMIAITFWETEEAMRASEARADQLRESAAGASSADIAAVDRFEVVLDTRT